MSTASSSMSIVNHVGHCVADLGRARRFYEEVLGFTFQRELTVPDGPASTLLSVERPVNMTAVYLASGDFVLELLHFARDGNPPQAGRVFNEPGLTHISVCVDDIAATAAKAAELGGQVLEHTNMGGHVVMIRDPDGQHIELLPMAYRDTL